MDGTRIGLRKLARALSCCALLSVALVGCQTAAPLSGPGGGYSSIGTASDDPFLGPQGTVAARSPYLGREAPPPPNGGLRADTRAETAVAVAGGEGRSLAAITETSPAGTEATRVVKTPTESAAPVAREDSVVPIAHTAPLGKRTTDGTSYEQLQEALTRRGVNSQVLRMTRKPGEWRFHCTIPDPKNKGFNINYEATEVGAGGLAAIRKVIEAMEREQSGQ